MGSGPPQRVNLVFRQAKIVKLNKALSEIEARLIYLPQSGNKTENPRGLTHASTSALVHGSHGNQLMSARPNIPLYHVAHRLNGYSFSGRQRALIHVLFRPPNANLSKLCGQLRDSGKHGKNSQTTFIQIRKRSILNVKRHRIW